MAPITEYSFRDYCEQFVKMKTTPNIRFLIGDAEEVVAVCYIDTEAGISFKVLGTATDTGINPLTDKDITLRYEDDFEIAPMDPDTIPEEIRDRGMSIILQSRESVSRETIVFRQARMFDEYRDSQFPDDVCIPTMANPPEEDRFNVWMRPVRAEDNVIIAIAIETVEQVTKGDEMVIMPGKDGFLSIHYGLYKAIMEEQDPFN
jgi:hypothetical protein